MYHANAGKNTIGTASPGKSSGNFRSSGKEIEIGMMTNENDTIEKRKLNTSSPFFFSQVTMPQFRKAAKKQKRRLKLMILPTPSTLEKSASVAKK